MTSPVKRRTRLPLGMGIGERSPQPLVEVVWKMCNGKFRPPLLARQASTSALDDDEPPAMAAAGALGVLPVGLEIHTLPSGRQSGAGA